MPIIIEVNDKRKYLTARFIGSVADDDLIGAWKEVYDGDEWVPGMPELIDLSAFEESKITLQGFKRLSEYCCDVIRREGLDTIIVSVYIPDQRFRNLMLSYRIVNKQAPLYIKLFNHIEDAKTFLNGYFHVIIQNEIQKMRKVFDAMADGVCIINQDHTIQYANSAMRTDFGSYKNKKCYEYFLDKKNACSWCRNSQVFVGEAIRRDWYSPKTKKTYELIDTSIENPDGTLSVIEIFRDITERKRIESKNERLLIELKNAFTKIKMLSGIIPICSHCKSILNDDGDWRSFEQYIDEHANAKFSHSICPQCKEKYYSDF